MENSARLDCKSRQSLPHYAQRLELMENFAGLDFVSNGKVYHNTTPPATAFRFLRLLLRSVATKCRLLLRLRARREQEQKRNHTAQEKVPLPCLLSL